MKPDGITIKGIADLLNMSGSTVSRVLSGKAKKFRISADTEELVKKTAKEHNYRPNQIARNLRLQKSNTIGLVIPDISNPFFCNLALKIETELRAKGKLILLCDTHDDSLLEKESIELLIDRQVDGLLVAPVGLSGDHFKNLSKPVVMIDRYFEELSIPFVSTNNFSSSYEATKLLLEKGHTQISCIQGVESTISNRERVNGYKSAIKDFGKGIVEVIGSDFTIENGCNSALKLFQGEQKPTAIFSLSNQITIGVMKAARELGIKIPDDVSLVSFDDQPYFELTEPSITSVRQPVEQIGKEAVRILFELMEGNPCESELIDAKLIQRKSVQKYS